MIKELLTEVYEELTKDRIDGVDKYNDVGGINPLWVKLRQIKMQEEDDRLEKIRQEEERRRIAEENKRLKLEYLSEAMELKYKFAKEKFPNLSDKEILSMVLKR